VNNQPYPRGVHVIEVPARALALDPRQHRRLLLQLLGVEVRVVVQQPQLDARRVGGWTPPLFTTALLLRVKTRFNYFAVVKTRLH
jgi:hypothetical protein